jgi:hypothetical protein
VSGSRWYRAACTAYFRGALAAGGARPASGGDGPSEQYRIAAWDARLTEVEEVAAPPPFDADGVGGLGAPFRSLGTTVWIRVAEPAETSEWFQSRAEILWITDWDVLESVRADGRISGRLRGTAYVEVKEIAPPAEVPPVADPVAAPPPAPTPPTSGDDRWLAMQGIDLPRRPRLVDYLRRPGCGWLGSLFGLSLLIPSCCCGLGLFIQWLGGLGAGAWIGLAALIGLPIVLGLFWLAAWLWSRGGSDGESGCAPRVLAIVLLLGLLVACLGVARTVASLFGYGARAVPIPFVGGEQLGCGQTAIGYRDRVGERIRVTCPASCRLQRVWGTDVYTDDSSICVAAQHAELLSGRPGAVTILVREGRDEYIASSRNGVESHPWGRWGGSFSFCDGPRPGTRCADAPLLGPQVHDDPRNVRRRPAQTPSRPARRRGDALPEDGAASERTRAAGSALASDAGVPGRSPEQGKLEAEASTADEDAPAGASPDDTEPGDGKGRTTSLGLSVSVDPHAADGATWDLLNGNPDISICVTTDVRRCVPPERDENSEIPTACRDTLRCDARIPVDAAARAIRVEVVDRDVAIHDLIGAGACEFGRVCRIGRARVAVGIPERRGER